MLVGPKPIDFYFVYYIKGTVGVISSDPIQRWQCLIYNVTLELFVWSSMN